MLHCSLHAARVDDFVGALKQLHVDFHWPFPVLSLSALQHVASGLLTLHVMGSQAECVTLLCTSVLSESSTFTCTVKLHHNGLSYNRYLVNSDFFSGPS